MLLPTFVARQAGPAAQRPVATDASQPVYPCLYNINLLCTVEVQTVCCKVPYRGERPPPGGRFPLIFPCGKASKQHPSVATLIGEAIGLLQLFGVAPGGPERLCNRPFWKTLLYYGCAGNRSTEAFLNCCTFRRIVATEPDCNCNVVCASGARLEGPRDYCTEDRDCCTERETVVLKKRDCSTEHPRLLYRYGYKLSYCGAFGCNVSAAVRQFVCPLCVQGIFQLHGFAKAGVVQKPLRLQRFSEPEQGSEASTDALNESRRRATSRRQTVVLKAETVVLNTETVVQIRL